MSPASYRSPTGPRCSSPTAPATIWLSATSTSSANPNVGLIFLLPGTGETLRVSGRAALYDDADLCERLAARGKPAKLVMKVEVVRAYFHCAKSILRANLWKPESWDADPLKVSFGKLFAELMKMDESAAPDIDARVRAGYGPENL